MGRRGEPRNLDDFATVSAEFRELVHGIWQKFSAENCGPY